MGGASVVPEYSEAPAPIANTAPHVLRALSVRRNFTGKIPGIATIRPALLSPPPTAVHQDADRKYCMQSSPFLVCINTGRDACIGLDGASARKALPGTPVPRDTQDNQAAEPERPQAETETEMKTEAEHNARSKWAVRLDRSFAPGYVTVHLQ